MIVYLGFGNSDDKLTQRDWARLQLELKRALLDHGVEWLGDWHSYPDSIYQNACYGFHLDDDKAPELMGVIKAIAIEFKQDAIAWNRVSESLFLGPKYHLGNRHPDEQSWSTT
jgi:hypothetical protein